MRMMLRPKLFAVATLLALLGMPGLSCFVPQQLLSAGEKECCRRMGLQCGSKDMSSPQSCCKSPSQQGAQPYIGSQHFQIAPTAAVIAFLPVRAGILPTASDSTLTLAQFHSPPLRLSETNSILRI